MGKNRQRHSRGGGGGGSGGGEAQSGATRRSSSGRKSTTESQQSNTAGANNSSTTTTPPTTNSQTTLWEWCYSEQQGLVWVMGCALIGSILGFGVGCGLLTGSALDQPSQWRVALGAKIRSTTGYQVMSLQKPPWAPLEGLWKNTKVPLIGSGQQRKPRHSSNNDPSHPRIFAVLREAVVREKGGYVHHDLGPLVPAPCGAARGLGMLRSTYHSCQTTCMPGIASEKLEAKLSNETTENSNMTSFMQEEVLIRVPLSYQMTRTVALDTLLPIIPGEVQRKTSLHELDDAALLVLLLAHERGIGRFSRWIPYIASLPTEPSCGYSKRMRPHMLDTIIAMNEELGVDVNGWPNELLKATQYADKIATGLTRDFGTYIKSPEGTPTFDNIQWALCQVASRATAGSEKHGSLRMVPVLDMINHDASAGGFVELTGEEKLENGDFIDAKEEDSGTFVVRSLRHGRRKALRMGQELLANYNVPHYSPLDWLVSLGFVPPERWNRWQKVDAALPRLRRDGPFAESSLPSSSIWSDKDASFLDQTVNSEW